MRFQLSRLKSVAHLNEYPVVINSRAYRREHIWFSFFFFCWWTNGKHPHTQPKWKCQWKCHFHSIWKTKNQSRLQCIRLLQCRQRCIWKKRVSDKALWLTISLYTNNIKSSDLSQLSQGERTNYIEVEDFRFRFTVTTYSTHATTALRTSLTSTSKCCTGAASKPIQMKNKDQTGVG